MATSTCETIRRGSGSSRLGLDVEVIGNGQALKATHAAMVATHFWGFCHKTANGKTNADLHVVEVRHV